MTTVTEDTPFALEDDTYHRLSDDINETETNWWSLNVPERKMGAWIHAAYFPNRKSVRTRVFVWGDDKENHTRCGICGSLLYSVVRDGAYVHVAMGSLVDDPSIRPTGHIFVGSKAPWFEITDDLPQSDEY